MSADRSIKLLLADKGIEVRKTADGPTRELWRGTKFLGHFSARTAVQSFLKEYSA